MPPLPDPASWSWWDAFLHTVAAVYLVLFAFFWFRFRGLERRARGGDDEAIQAFNRSLKGFPNMVYAKMLGRRPR